MFRKKNPPSRLNGALYWRYKRRSVAIWDANADEWS